MNTQTHLSFKVSKRLKEFLGESAPEPIKSEMGQVWLYDMECPDDGLLQGGIFNRNRDAPAYQLHDLLSKPFCAEMRLACKWGDNSLSAANRGIQMVHDVLSAAYFDGGLPAVEKALVEMMEAK